MGYIISSLSRLPVIDGIDLYIFILGKHGWENDFLSKINKNFDKLASKVGSETAIVSGHNDTDLRKELAICLEQASWNEKSIINLLVAAGQQKPAILILGAHPQKFKDNDLILYAELDRIKELFSSPENFFDELCEFSQTRETYFLDKFKEKKMEDSIFDQITINLGLIGFNIKLLRDITKRFKL